MMNYSKESLDRLFFILLKNFILGYIKIKTIMKKTPFDNQLLSVLIKNQKEKFKWIVIVYHITIRIVKKISKLNYFNIYIILKSKVVIVKFTIDKILKVKIITFK